MSRPVTIQNLNDAIQCYLAGTSMKKLAKEIGVTRPTLIHRFREHGVVIRGRSEAERLKWVGIKENRTLVERQCQAAWAAVRGRKAPLQELLKKAKTRQRKLLHRGRHEHSLLLELRRRGLEVRPQEPVGPYSLDLAIHPDAIAVEILTGYVDIAKTLRVKRVHHLRDCGWAVLVLYCPGTRWVNVPRLADYVMAFLEECRREPAARRQYRVIRCDGKVMPARRGDRPDGA